jgi:uncharacterized membrane protein
MSSRHTEIQAQTRDGDSLQVASHETDSPILPMSQLQALQEFRPDLVDWVVRRTEEEAHARHRQEATVNRFIFVERMSGTLGGIAIAIFGLATSAYLALHGAEWVAGIMAGGTLVALVSVIVRGRQGDSGK